MSQLSWLDQINRTPPWFCRLIARVGKRSASRPMTNREIAKVSGLSIGTIKKLSRRLTWNQTTTEVVWRFTLACGLDLRRPREAITAFKRCRMFYLRRKLPAAQKELYNRLLSMNK